MPRTAPVTESMVEDYLNGPAYTVQTYLAHKLRGNAKKYAGRYADRMIARLRARYDVISVDSIRGRTAYRRTEEV